MDKSWDFRCSPIMRRRPRKAGRNMFGMSEMNFRVPYISCKGSPSRPSTNPCMLPSAPMTPMYKAAAFHPSRPAGNITSETSCPAFCNASAASSTARSTAAQGWNQPSVLNQPTRKRLRPEATTSPDSDVEGSPAKTSLLNGILGNKASRCHTEGRNQACRTAAKSSTQCAIGPVTPLMMVWPFLSPNLDTATPCLVTRSCVGLRP
mmetsp:Transcript_158024/g.506851  ORF Transcript_158024/g.506851 Transcript_158024/m.506851 type:complete len:206 (-) Transcript_158024:901-1518(-)